VVQKNKIFLSIFLSLLFSCAAFKAYFNTFYNAKKIFNETEEAYRKNNYKLNQGIKQGYEKAIQKFLYVIKYYPKSPFIDDALYYIILSYIRLEEYDKAIKKFEEIVKYAPYSKFTLYGFDKLSENLIEKGKFEEFKYVYLLIKNLEIYKNFKGEKKLFYKIFNDFLEENYEGVIESSENFIDKIKENKLKKKILEILLKSYIKTKKEEKAISILNEIYKKEKYKEIPSSYYMILSDVYLSKGDTNKAIEILEDVYKRNLSKEVFFKLIEIKKKKGQFIRELLKEFKEKTQEDSLRQRVIFEIAETYDERDSLEKKEELLKEITNISRSTEYGKRANEYLEVLKKIKEIEKKSVKDYLSIAEDYYIKLSKPLYSEYFLKKAIEIDDSIYTPKAYYFLFFLQKEILKKEDAIKTFEEFKNKYPKSFYIEEIKRRLNVP